MNKKLDLKLTEVSIYDLLGEKFYIPDYQRGYRWTPDEIDKLVKDLNEYIKNYNKDTSSFYCMQPLVVRQDGDKWEIIDGQQRLTSIYLILQACKDDFDKLPLDSDKTLFELSYKTRDDDNKEIKSSEYLKTLDPKHKRDNIDFYHMYYAGKAIRTAFENYKIKTNNFISSIINDEDEDDRTDVKFIWYNVTDECKEPGYAEKVFSRLNIGKIRLTNAELLKALFLNRIKKEQDMITESAKSQYRREGITNEILFTKIDDAAADKVANLKNKMALEWDAFEKTLQDDKFWAFLYGKDDKKYSTRLEFIFDSIKEKKSSDQEFFTFNKYEESFSEYDAAYVEYEKYLNNVGKGKIDPDEELENNLESVKLKNSVVAQWKNIAGKINKYTNWYEDKVFYHLIGYLRAFGESLSNIEKLEDSSKNREVFISELFKKAKKIALNDLELENLVYPENSAQIKKTLLLFNVLSILKLTKSDLKFSFSNYHNESWDIEHVRPQTDQDIENNDKKRWIETNLSYFTGIEYPSKKDQKLALFIDHIKKITEKDDFDINTKEKIEAVIPLLSVNSSDLNDLFNVIKHDKEGIYTSVNKTLRNRSEWIIEVLSYYSGVDYRSIKDKEIINKCDDIFNKAINEHIDSIKDSKDKKDLISIELAKLFNLDSPNIHDIFERINNCFGTKDDDLEDKNSISNLVLLDMGTNRKYKNAFYKVKRDWIIKREKEGIFIPFGTKNVFMKAYSKDLSDLSNWNESDATEYFKQMESILKCL